MNNAYESHMVTYENEVFEVELAVNRGGNNLVLTTDDGPMRYSRTLGPFLDMIVRVSDNFEYVEKKGVPDETLLYHVVKFHDVLYYIKTCTDSWMEGEEHYTDCIFEFTKTEKKVVEVYDFQEF